MYLLNAIIAALAFVVFVVLHYLPPTQQMPPWGNAVTAGFAAFFGCGFLIFLALYIRNGGK